MWLDGIHAFKQYNRKWKNGCPPTANIKRTSTNRKFWKYLQRRSICVSVKHVAWILAQNEICSSERYYFSKWIWTKSSIDFPPIGHRKMYERWMLIMWNCSQDFHWYAYHEIIVYIERLIRVPVILSHLKHDIGRMHVFCCLPHSLTHKMMRRKIS